ncbi:MAG: GAF domain-containing sensor histidine kinase [Bdellovibrionales bacterium]|nr:GAF domain-containing sensor histidine kinase [Bdellovibrionales bacterium]
MENTSENETQNLAQASDVILGKVIQQVNKKMISGSNHEQILDFIFDSLNLLIPYDRIGIALLEKDNTVARLIWVRSKKQCLNLARNYSAALHGSSLENIIKTGEPRIISDLRSYYSLHPTSESTALALKDGILSSLTCPLRAGDKPVGFVFFSSFQPYMYENQHVQIFSAISDQLSIVVEQAHLKKYFEASESRERALARVMHDLRAPVSTIKACLNYAATEDWYQDLQEPVKEVFQMLNSTTQEMLVLLEELLELRRVKDTSSSLDIQKVNLIDFINDVTETGEVLGRAKEISFDWVPRFDLPDEAEFDLMRIRRVLDNLITNAIKFSKRGTKIKFDVRAENSKLFFSIQDRGQGIPEQDMDLLFTEFGRTSTSPTEGESSTGLGLAIAKEIVEKHGGQISAQSQIGEGSTFVFWIPLPHKTMLH